MMHSLGTRPTETAASQSLSPLAQLNLMVWLVWSTPDYEWLRPVLSEEGFTLWAIGHKLLVPTTTRATASQKQLAVSCAVAPDLILRHNERGLLLPVECKSSSFGPILTKGKATEQTQQAAALLCMTGEALADQMGVEPCIGWSCHVLYVVNNGHEAALGCSLAQIAGGLRAAEIPTASHGQIGVRVGTDGVYLVRSGDTSVPIKALESSNSAEVRVLSTRAGEDPALLYLIPWDPSIAAPTGKERQILDERVRAALTSLIGGRLESGEFVLRLEEVLREAVEVWGLWRDRNATKAVRRAVRRYVQRVLKEIGRMGAKVSEKKNDEYQISGVDPDLAEQIRKYLSSVAFRRGNIGVWQGANQLGFETVASGWAGGG